MKIAALVSEHGIRAWSTVSAELPGRTGKQCRERWHNHLDPIINKSEWSIEEDLKLLCNRIGLLKQEEGKGSQS